MARIHLVLVLCVAAAAALMASFCAAAGEGAAATAQELRRGFSVTHDQSYSQFQPVLADPTGAFALGFLRVNATMLDLAVLHLPSAFPLWRAIPDRPAPWSAPASLTFDGGLALTDRAANKVLWSAAAASASAGDRVVLLSTSNLQIQSTSAGVVWQSFDYPSDTIVQGQNFTSAAALFTLDRRFAMRLGSNYFALYIEPPPPSSGGVAAAMYFKRTALEAKAQIVAGGGPTYARVEPDGFLAMYQKEGPPADVLSFDTFNRGVRALRRMTLEPNGNLRAYYWDGTRWALDYTAITETCELPTTCGAYSVCAQPSGGCECLANATDGSGCAAATPASVRGSLCGTTGGEVGGLYWAVRRQGVEPVNKELLGSEHAASATDCEARCERNCSCWGAVYSNGTGYCYLLDYPAQLLVVGDERKLGYFKVRSLQEAAGRGRSGGGAGGVKAALLTIGVAAVVGAAAFGAYRVWDRRRRTAADARRQLGAVDDGLSPGPYKNLGSFSSVELTNSFRRPCGRRDLPAVKGQGAAGQARGLARTAAIEERRRQAKQTKPQPYAEPTPAPTPPTLCGAGATVASLSPLPRLDSGTHAIHAPGVYLDELIASSSSARSGGGGKDVEMVGERLQDVGILNGSTSSAAGDGSAPKPEEVKRLPGLPATMCQQMDSITNTRAPEQPRDLRRERERVYSASMISEQREERNRKRREAYKRKKCDANNKENDLGRGGN
ncbi:hypothetical protein PAHAL_1G252200 [Panicum hallii]|uniref:non-specific serine/threonine protein kinase n=1 Tax=Panicum hallii TaxID=206008 RepID=A0A2T8KWA9_9POAL|nr:hypothetical protein PAHAL_1G252200 [Panicum hallii]